MVAHVRHSPAHVESLALQAGGLLGERARVDIDQRHPRAVRCEHFSVREPEPARATRDDGAEPGHVEARGNVHVQLLL